MNQTDTTLHSLTNAAEKCLGDISHWTLRKHAKRGTITVVRIGKRLFLTSAEISRIQREGLPPLR